MVTRDKVVLDLNLAAQKRGAAVGMNLSEAKVLLRGGRFVAWCESDYLAAQEAWLNVAAAYTCALEPGAQHEAFLDLSGHPAPLSIARKAVDAIQALGYQVHWGLAQTKWLASIGAQFNAHDDPLQDSADFLWPLAIKHLPISLEARERFQMLGYSTVGQLTELRMSTLREQFGEESHRIYQLVWGGGFEPVYTLYPKDALHDHLYFESPIEDLEMFDQALRLLSNRLGKKLRDRDLCGQSATVYLDTEKGVRLFKRSFNKPIEGPRTVYGALSLTVNKVEEPVSGIRVRLPSLTKAEQLQRTLQGVQTAQQPAAEKALTAVRKVYGDKIIQRGSEIPTDRRSLLLREWRNATGWR